MLPKFAAIQDRAKEQSLKSVARSLQVALETYYLAEGRYIQGEALTIDNVITLLQEKQLIQDEFLNPFTNAVFNQDDSSGKLSYSYSEENQGYIVEVFGKENTQLLLSFSNQ